MRSNFANYLQAFCAIFLFFTLSCADQPEESQKKKTQKLTQANETHSIDAKVIYGEDNRLDLYQIQDPSILAAADATVALIFMTDLIENGEQYDIKTRAFKNNFRYPLCTTERFYEQETAAFCSGFLVKPNIIVTAGHCVQNQGYPSSDCSTTRFVFGFSVDEENILPRSVSKSEVYHCNRILKQKADSFGADYSVVELDRPVLNHQPLQMRTQGTVAIGDELVVMGHPSGLPTKVASGAKVRSMQGGYFRANLDTYGGNSGSAVINSNTLEVEGILVRGETDYVVRDNICTTSKVCENEDCRGEDVTFISEALPYIP